VNLPVPANSGPIVIRAALSPVAAGGALIGALIGLLAGGGLTGLVFIAVLGWLVGVGVTVVLGRNGGRILPEERIDPFAVGEPWRHFVRDAVTARNRFDDAMRSTKPGPLKDRLATIRESIDSGVRECWEVAKQAQNISQARKALDVPSLRRRLDSLQTTDADTAVTEGSIRAQLESADRLDAVLNDVTTKLQVLEAQLTEAVTRAIEVGALAGHDDDLSGVGTTVDQVVDNLEALRLALSETSRTSGQHMPRQELPPPSPEPGEADR
jgi:hypothetical protein